MVGFALGGLLTEYDLARQSFYLGGVISILINVSACFLDKKLEGVKTIV